MSMGASYQEFEKELNRLVEKFGRNLAELKSSAYDEAKLRLEYLDPFFKALGYDLENRAGLIQKEREVEIESATQIGGGRKRADYLFRTDKRDRFVCEAKKPAEELTARYAFQAKRYAWNKGVPLAVLTDFEELKIFVVGGKPYADEPQVGEWKAWSFRQFPLVARELWDLLARDKVAAGSIDQALDALPKKARAAGKGKARQQWLIKPDRTRALDTAFLEFLDETRKELASDLYKNNDHAELLDGNKLTEAVQRIIDRILFLRICEDRDIDTGTKLKAIVETWRKNTGDDDSGRRAHQQPMELHDAPPADHGGHGIRAPQDSLWRAVVRHFRALDRRPPSHVPFFNGNLFKPHFTETLILSDEWLAGFIGELSDDESPYLFDVIPVEILGSVYERFLGKVVRPHGKGITVEEKPEVRKAGGVYYTPRYIVDYIVEQTAGKLLDEIAVVGRVTPCAPPGANETEDGAHGVTRPTLKDFEKKTAALRFLDPACGSGSFLIRAFERVCEHWLRWLTAQLPAQGTASSGVDWEKIAQAPLGTKPEAPEKDARAEWLKRNRKLCWRDAATGDLHLTLNLKRAILTQNIFGVDLDSAAVEVTQLSLYLKMLENENRTTLERARELFAEAVAILPPLQDNIKCGNSLIASDFLEGALPSDETIAEMNKLNTFDWNVGFEKIMKAGGFDAVIGNPPYVRQESLKETKEYFEKKYQSFSGTGDLYTYFMEKGVKLIRPGGRYSIIVSSSFLRATYAEALRETLLKHAALIRIVDFGGFAVFADAKDTYVCIPVLAKEKQSDHVEVSKVKTLETDSVLAEMSKTDFVASIGQFNRDAWSLRSEAQLKTFAKIVKAGEPLGSYVSKKIFYGIKTGFNDAFVVTTEQRNKLVAKAKASAALIHPCRGGEDVREYFIEPTDSWLIVLPAGWTRSQMGKPGASASETKAWDWLREEHPSIASHLEPFTKALRDRQDQGDFWWELRPCDYYDTFDKPKLVYPDICKHPRFTYDDTGIYLANTAYALGTSDKYLLGILNSRLFWFAISNISIPFGVRAGEFRYRLIYQYMEKVPVRKLDLKKPAEKAAHDKMVDLVNRRLALTPKLRAATAESERAVLQNAVTATDQQIDQLVYELYGLTEDEIKLVEGGQ